MWFFKTLLVIILIFYIFEMIIKWTFKRKMKKLERQVKQQFTPEEQEPQREQSNPHIDPNIGEYTEFEEVE